MSATFLEPHAPATVAPEAGLRAPASVRATGLLPVMCSLSGESIRSCQVTATAVVDARTVTVGRGHASLKGRPAAHKVAVGVELTDLGRELAAREGGVTVVLDAVVHGAATAHAVSEAHVVALHP